jgi:hypothetical protein
MRKWLPTSRAGLALVFLLLGLGVLFNARRTYLHYAEKPIEAVHREASASAGTAVQAKIKELRSKLEKDRVGASRYSVAAEKNLFSPSRRAWQPPAPKKAPAPAKAEKKPAPVTARRDVVLYGTYIAGGMRKAVLHFSRFGHKMRRLAEGEEARDEKRPNQLSYTLLKVEPRQVVLKDSRGQEFTVGLYDNKRRRPLKTAAAAKPKITVEQAKAPPPAAGAAPAAKRSSGGKLTAKTLRKLSPAKKEALVQQGVLKKFSTPFGPVYKRAK